ncbi:MAG: sugar phosphate isomerase/epimerase [Clostridiaceae bacterium]|jgi:sugar phosphate isomerase/epimerase|nr:sugar phosphate isomerase/epimerase [Clostridiaceae bacterium]
MTSIYDNNSVKKMKLSVTVSKNTSKTVPVLLGGDFRESIRKAKQLGYDAVELHIVPGDINVKEIVSCCEKNNIEVSAIGTGRSYVVDKLSLIDDSSVNREMAVARLKEYIDIAESVGSYVIIGCMKGNMRDYSLYDTYENRLSESMKQVSLYAAEKNVLLLLEAINRYENNYMNTAAETLDFIKRNDIPKTKVLLDTFHMNIEEKDMCESIRECGDMLGYVHIADSNRMHAGGGHIDFKKIIDALKDINYNGYLSAECLPIPDGDIAARKGLDFIKPLL